MKTLALGAHHDDIDVMLGYTLADAETAVTLVATDGKAGSDMTGTCPCTG